MGLIKKAYEIDTNHLKLKVLLYGQPGIGKTTLALSSPRPLLIDTDGGVHRVRAEDRVDTLQVSNYKEVLQVLNENLSEYDTIVFDTAGRLLDYMSAWLIENDPKLAKRDGALTISGFGSRKAEFQNLLKRISIMRKYLIFVAHEKEEKNGDTKIIRPEIGGSSGGDLIKDLDLVGYMEAHGNIKTISFTPCEKFYAKNSAHMDEVIKIPILGDKVKNTFMRSIIAKNEEAIRKESDQIKTFKETITKITSIVEGISDADSANAAISQIAELEHIWDSKAKANELIQARTNSLGLKYVKDHGYVPIQQEQQDVA